MKMLCHFLSVVCYETYLNGSAFIKTVSGLGPAVYLLISHGNVICSGTMGTANSARRSFGMPASMSFKVVTASVAAVPSCGKKNNLFKVIGKGISNRQTPIIPQGFIRQRPVSRLLGAYIIARKGELYR